MAVKGYNSWARSEGHRERDFRGNLEAATEVSGLLAGKVWQSDLRHKLKPLAACLADQANDRGEGIYSSIAYLAWKLSTSERSVQRGMRELREMTVIKQDGFKKFGRVFVPIYRLLVSNLPDRPPWRFQQGDTDGVTLASPRGADGVTKTRDGVTSMARRGDTALSPKPSEEPLEKPVREEEEAASAASSVEIVRAFEALDCKPFGPPEFQQAWTRAWSQAETGSVWSEVMEAAIGRCGDLGVKVPGKFYMHKRKIEELEVQARYRRTPL
jgi:hypothetical protein